MSHALDPFIPHPDARERYYTVVNEPGRLFVAREACHVVRRRLATAPRPL